MSKIIVGLFGLSMFTCGAVTASLGWHQYVEGVEADLDRRNAVWERMKEIGILEYCDAMREIEKDRPHD